MSKKIPLEQLLHWRLEQAEASAPPPPKAAQLLRSARPWWEKRPKYFRSQIEHLRALQSAHSPSTTNKRRKGSGIPVPALVVRKKVESGNYALVSQLSVIENKLRLRFTLEPKLSPVDQNLEVTFISHATLSPMFYVTATVSADNTFQIETELPVDIAKAWQQLKLTNPLPFGLIIHSEVEA
jgi:hypothetical protein